MLVIANGAPKSGSTWLFNILDAMHEYATLPEEFLLDTKNVNPEIKYDELERVLTTLDYEHHDYLLKNHFGAPEQRDLILKFPNVYAFDINRALKDVVVSGYYYRLREEKNNESFERYYWIGGRYLADRVRRYHTVWMEAPRSRAMEVSYEGLKESFCEDVRAMASFLGLELSDADVARIEAATTMDSLRKKYDDKGEIKFFRKGVVGDWVNHFKGSTLADIEAVEHRGVDHVGPIAKNAARLRIRYYRLFKRAGRRNPHIVGTNTNQDRSA